MRLGVQTQLQLQVGDERLDSKVLGKSQVLYY